jgi:glycosyltransferase involved in cell wall biosynthesis
MKICHLLNYAPHSSGLYESAREIIEEENNQGIDARFLDTNGSYHPYLVDRGIHSCDLNFLASADLVVMHQMIDKSILDKVTVPIILVLHGTPRDCFWAEIYQNQKSYSLIMDLVRDPRFTFVTMWSRHMQFWKQVMGERVHFIPSCVNLDSFNPNVIPYKFRGSSLGSPNILFGDTWRIDKNPFEVMHAFKIFKESYPLARIHIYCESPTHKELWAKFMVQITEKKDYYIGEYAGMIKDFPNVVKACDFVVTPQRDATRIIRESLAIGTPVVAVKGCEYTLYTADHYYPEEFAKAMIHCWEDIKSDLIRTSEAARSVAVQHFNQVNTVKELKKVFEKCLEKERGK